ncbi:MAG: two-component sensor histidine kinase, partial [Pseudolabrys sp.]
MLCSALGTPAHASVGVFDGMSHAAAASQQIAALTLTLGLICFAMLAVLALLRTRKTAAAAELAARDETMTLHADIDRLKTLLLAQPQVLVAWAAGADEPEIIGDTGLVVSSSVPERVLAFGAWLEPAAAQLMERAVEALRNEGRGFVMTLTTSAGRPLEAEGRAVAGRAVLRLRDVSGIERDLIDLAARHDKLNGDVETLKALLESLPGPVWAH